MSDPIVEQLDGVLVRPSQPDDTTLALLTWRQPAGDTRLAQVYLDGRLHDVATRPDQRQMWLHVNRSRSHRIELLVVDPADAWSDFSKELTTWDPPFVTAVQQVLVRDESLPVDSRVIVTLDGVDDDGAWLWGPGDSRGGFGGLFGVGPFGYDAATGPGFGLGAFGAGPLLADGRAWVWRRDDLPAGEHTLEMRIEDRHGHIVATHPQQTFTIDALPDPPADLTLDETFTLRWV